MILPNQLDLPFFSYGLFRPGQIGYRRLQPHVAAHEAGWHVRGILFDRDGLPILDQQGQSEVPGALIRFQDGVAQSIRDHSRAMSRTSFTDGKFLMFKRERNMRGPTCSLAGSHNVEAIASKVLSGTGETSHYSGLPWMLCERRWTAIALLTGT